MSEPLGLIAAALGILVSFSILVGILVRLMLLPWLREHLVEPVRETRKQVTENHHSNPRPTVLDRIDDVAQQIARARGEVAENTRETRAMARMFDGHLEWSQHEVDRLWAAWERLAERHHGEGNR